eukprot:8281964-Ditylum_brightwellii.AAC.1
MRLSTSAGFIALILSGTNAWAPVPHARGASRHVQQPLKMGFFNDLFTNTKQASNAKPKVEVPPNFEIPEPKPLTLTRSSDLPIVLK